MPKIDVTALPFVARGGYPPPHDKLVAGRSRKRLGDEAGLTQFGVNLTMLTPGAFSSLRYWHENQEEFVFLIEGELTLIVEGTEHLLARDRIARVGPAVRRQLVNGGRERVVVLAIGASGTHEGRDARAWESWEENGLGRPPQEVPLPHDLPSGA